MNTQHARMHTCTLREGSHGSNVNILFSTPRRLTPSPPPSHGLVPVCSRKRNEYHQRATSPQLLNSSIHSHAVNPYSTYDLYTIYNTTYLDRRAIKYIYVVFYYTLYSIKPRNGVTHDRQEHIIYTGLEKQSTWTQDRRTVVEHSTVDRAGLKMQANDFLSLPPNAHTHAETQARLLPSFRPPHTIHTCSYPTPPQVHTHPFPLQVHLLLPIHNPTNNTITRSFSKSVKTSVTMVADVSKNRY